MHTAVMKKMNMHLVLDNVQEWHLLLWQTSLEVCYLKTEKFIDALLTAEEEKRQRRHEEGVMFTELEPKEEVRYGEELEERKQQDIFSHTSTREFMEALRPEMDENLSSAQSSLERHLFHEPARQAYQRLHSNKMSLLEPLEPEERIKIEVPKPQRTEDPMTEETPYDCCFGQVGNSWINITGTRTLVSMENILERHMQGA